MAKTTDKYESHYLPPTPQIGESVQWYPNADHLAPRAALVTAVSAPGNVELTVFSAGQMYARTVNGCLHISNPIHGQGNMQTQESGAWDFVPGNTSHLDRSAHAKAEIDRKSRLREEAEFQRMRAQEERQRVLATTGASEET